MLMPAPMAPDVIEAIERDFTLHRCGSSPTRTAIWRRSRPASAAWRSAARPGGSTGAGSTACPRWKSSPISASAARRSTPTPPPARGSSSPTPGRAGRGGRRPDDRPDAGDAAPPAPGGPVRARRGVATGSPSPVAQLAPDASASSGRRDRQGGGAAAGRLRRRDRLSRPVRASRSPMPIMTARRRWRRHRTC